MEGPRGARTEEKDLVRQLRAFMMGTAFAVVAVGFAYAVPASIQATADHQPAPDEGVEVLSSQTSTGEVPDTEEEDGDAEGEDGSGKPNHGTAVSAAAHCDVKGRAHGELVRAIAKDKDATVADAEAACADAMAAAAPTPTTRGKPAKAPKAVKAPKGPKGPAASSAKPGKGHGKASVVEDVETEPVETTETEEQPAEHPGNGNGKGKSK